MKKRIISLLLIVVILISSLPIVFSDEVVQVDANRAKYGVKYVYSNSKIDTHTYYYCINNGAFQQTCADYMNDKIIVPYGTELTLTIEVYGENVVITNSNDSVATITSKGTYPFVEQVETKKVGTTTIHVDGGNHATFKNAVFDIVIEVVKGELEIKSDEKPKTSSDSGYEVETKLKNIDIIAGTVRDKNTGNVIAGTYYWTDSETCILWNGTINLTYKAYFFPDDTNYLPITEIQIGVKSFRHKVEIKDYSSDIHMNVYSSLKDCDFGNAKAYHGDNVVNGTFTWTNENWIPTVSGTTTRELVFTPSDLTLYEQKTINLQVTIDSYKPNPTDPTGKSLTYNSSIQALITEGNTGGNDWWYSYVVQYDDEITNTAPTTGWSTQKYNNIPRGINAGTYRVWYKVISNNADAYEWTEPNYVDATIAPKASDGLNVTLDKNSFVYTGEEIKPAVIVGNGIEYDLSYSDNINPGTASITLEFKGNYTGSKTINFSIVLPKTSNLKVPGKIYNLSYDGTSKALFSEGSVENGTILYAVTESDEKPADDSGLWFEYGNNSLKRINAGTYYIHYKVVGNQIGESAYHYDVPQNFNGYIQTTIYTASLLDKVKLKDGNTDLNDYIDKRYGYLYFDSYYFSYQGNPITLNVEVEGFGNDDYTVTYEDNNALGLATATIHFDNQNYDDVEIYFEIANCLEISLPSINGINYNGMYLIEYNGFYQSIISNFVLDTKYAFIVYSNYDSDKDKFLNYDISYSTPYIKDAGLYLVELDIETNKNDRYYYKIDDQKVFLDYYYGLTEYRFNMYVTPKDSINTSFEVILSDETEFVYSGTAINPIVESVKVNNTLIENTDYQISYMDNVNAGYGKVVITFTKGDYKDKVIVKTFEITPKKLVVDINNLPILVNNLTYNGDDQKFISNTPSTGNDSVFWVYKKGDNDYYYDTVCYAGVYNFGAYLKYYPIDLLECYLYEDFDIANYADSDSVNLGTVTVSPKKTGIIVEGVENKAYTGNAITQNITVKDIDNDRTLYESNSYEISYSDNANAGTAYVTITLKGNYEGTIVKTFAITEAGKTSAFGGTTYDTLSEALEAAGNSQNPGKFVSVIGNVDGGIIYVPTGVTLNLNGFDLTNLKVIVVGENGSIIDTADKKGVVSAETYALSTAQTYLPIYDNDKDGYSFFKLGVVTKTKTVDTNKMYGFYIDDLSVDYQNAIALIKKAGNNNGYIEAVVTYSWTTAKSTVDQIVVYDTATIFNEYLNDVENNLLTASINESNVGVSSMRISFSFTSKTLGTSITGSREYTKQ